ncbi:MAG: sigma factor [Streptosporangiaceae bacterium]
MYRQLRSPLLWHLRCMGASQPEAADAVQDAFAHALLASDRLRDDHAWPAWLRTVAARSSSTENSGAPGPRAGVLSGRRPAAPAEACLRVPL